MKRFIYWALLVLSFFALIYFAFMIAITPKAVEETEEEEEVKEEVPGDPAAKAREAKAAKDKAAKDARDKMHAQAQEATIIPDNEQDPKEKKVA